MGQVYIVNICFHFFLILLIVIFRVEVCTSSEGLALIVVPDCNSGTRDLRWRVTVVRMMH